VAGHAYYYVVVPDDGSGNGFKTNEAEAIPQSTGTVLADGGGVTITWNPQVDGDAAEIHPNGWNCNTPVINSMTYLTDYGYVEVTCSPIAGSWVCKNPFGMAAIDSNGFGDTVDVEFNCAGQDHSCYWPASTTQPCQADSASPGYGGSWGTTTNLGTMTCKAKVSYGTETDVQGWSTTCFNDP
jgi:hypothetical protein